MRRFLNVLKYLLAFGLLAFVLQHNWMPGSDQGLEAVWQKHWVDGKPLNHSAFLLSLLLFFTGIFLTQVRWHLMMRAQDLGMGIWNTIRIGFIGFFFNTLLPGAVGGDLVKAAAVCKNQSRKSVAVTIILLDRAIALWGLIFFSGASGVIFWSLGYLETGSSSAAKTLIRYNLSFCLITAFGWYILKWLPLWRVERFERRLRTYVANPAAEFWLTFWRYRKMPRVILLSFLISWSAHICLTIAFYMAAQVLKDSQAIPGLWEHFLIVPIGLVIQAAPMFPGGAGIGEFGFGALYSWFGADRAMGVLASLVQRIGSWIVGVSCYLICLASAPATKPEEKT